MRLYANRLPLTKEPMTKLKSLAFGSLVVVGCAADKKGPDGPEILPNLTVPDAPEEGKGFQIITPIFEDVQPSMDYEVCTWTDVVTDGIVDVKSTLSYQTEPPGHHVVLFYTQQKQPAGTQRVCNDSDMATFRFLAGSGATGEVNMAPGDLVYRVPAGSQIVVQHHYLNATDQVLRGQSVVNVNFADPTAHNVPSGNLAIVNTALMVQQGDYSLDMHCAFDRSLKLWYLIPHEHQWGKHVNIDLTIAGSKMNMFDLDWDPSFAFHAPEVRRDPTQPLTVNPGDTIDVHCEWNNDSGRVLDFGFEMCVSFGEFVDDEGVGSRACDSGNWIPF
jgi:hypothetical protein